MEHESSPRKSILFITYHFPPDAAIGGRRILRLARFLRERSWDVAVLTVNERYYEARDRSLRTEPIRTHRTAMLRSMRHAFVRGKNVLAGIVHRERPGEGTPEAGPPRRSRPLPPERRATTPAAPVPWLKRVVFSLLWCPDDKVGWLPFGLAACLRLAPRGAVLYSSSPPHSVHLIPLVATRLSRRRPWIAEFRDPWTDFPKPAFVVSELSRWLERRWEAAVIARSTEVVVVTDAMKRAFDRKYPRFAHKIKVFSNGFDRAEIPARPAPPPAADGAPGAGAKKTVFLHAGTLYIGRDPTIFLRALAALIAEGALVRDRVEVQFIGDALANETEPIDDIARSLGLGGVVRCPGVLPYAECLARMGGADVLLLFNINQPLQVPAKFFEYLALGKRILSISTGGITDELLDRTRSGASVRPDDLDGMKRAILDLATNRAGAADEREIGAFDLAAIFEALANDLDSVIRPNGCPPPADRRP